ncbi:MAG: hypothetical protein HYZ54_01805 [Ignavibacteriae bacterium]|nr:hypothetical protein [Ignavibacteriota bacterium]
MDTLKEIEKQIDSIRVNDDSRYLDSILIHIQRAEFYYIQGRTDTGFYNDVIYRSNQAYEGALKESYKVLADKTEDEVLKKTPNDIEKYLETENVFKDRVVQLFKNYRSEWRNKSTHDHKLFFDQNEAFIALTSVTSFVHLLLKQIQDKISYKEQQKKLSVDRESVEKIKLIRSSITKNPIEKLTDLIIEFAKQKGEQIFNNGSNTKEVGVLGVFHAYIESIGKVINIQKEPKINIHGIEFWPDFKIEIDDEIIVLELTRHPKYLTKPIYGSLERLLIYMQELNIYKGVVYYANFNESNPKPEIVLKNQEVNGKTYQITEITT